MTEMKTSLYNLWTEPWITLEKLKGGVERLSIEQTLINAHRYRAICDPSPLVIVGIHRLLVAILQYAMNPLEKADLQKLWHSEKFAPELIEEFGSKFAYRFDLFSPDQPFMQSADLSAQPDKKNKVSSVTRLTYDIPSGTYVSHYRHGDEEEFKFCPSCTARHLVTMPAFATSGGPGIRPSINGVPPIYVLPGGENLYQTSDVKYT